VKLLVVGSPIAHSLSPAMMTAALARADIDGTYRAIEVTAPEWDERLATWFGEGVHGMNVTVPHKERALRSALRASDTAREIGAANTLARSDGGWIAHNTDGPGFVDWIERLGARDAARREALVLGAGGGARAVVWALRRLGCARIRVSARTAERAAALEGVHAESWGSNAPAGGLVVQCTPLGLRPHDPPAASVDQLRGAALAIDLVYPDTPFLAAARDAGVRSAGGMGLLVAQAVRSFEIWTGIAPDPAVLEEAARREAGRRSAGH